MEKPLVNIVQIMCVVIAVPSVCVIAEHFYFQIIENTNTTSCSEYVGRVNATISAKQCCFSCLRNGQCRGVVYNPGTMTCKNIHAGRISDSGCQADGGAYYYSKVCDRFLVSGPYGVADSQLSASSYLCEDPSSGRVYCQPWEARYGSAKYARLSSTGLFTGGWIANDRNPSEHYIQVEFLKPTVVRSVVMQARDPGGLARPFGYVKSFNVQHSEDCATFKNIVDDNGTALILEGNRNAYDRIYRDLPKRVKARCFRINFIDWTRDLAMRFDLIGCP